MDEISWALGIAGGYRIDADLPYGPELDRFRLLDVYRPAAQGPSRPTLVFMHGGGWTAGSSRTTWCLWFLPFLARNWTVVNIGYRPREVAPAPAALQDCLAALCWVADAAPNYDIDMSRLAIGGLSAGAHLALAAGMIPQRAANTTDPMSRRAVEILGADLLRDTARVVRPAAILNWSGVTDLAALLTEPTRRLFATNWIGDRADALDLASALSPLSHIGPDLPPVVTVHGACDEIVPPSQATRLHEALSDAGVANELILSPGAGHGSLDLLAAHYPRVLAFLAKHGLEQPIGSGEARSRTVTEAGAR